MSRAISRAAAVLALLGCYALLQPIGVRAGEATDAAQAERNKQIVLAFPGQVFNQHDAAGAYARYAAPDFPHHAQWAMQHAKPQEIVKHNIESFQRQAQQFPGSRREIKQIIDQGDLMMVHLQSRDGPGVGDVIANPKKGNERAPKTGEEVIDIWQLQGGRIFEHRKVSQPTPSTADVY